MKGSKTRMGRLGAAVVVMALAFTSPVEAFSYAYFTTEDGGALYWNSEEIEIVLDESLALLGEPSEIEMLAIDAFDEWVDTAKLPMEFTFVSGRCGIAFAPGGENENCIAVKEDGPVDAGERAASTFVTYGTESGEIIDADIVITNEAGLWRIGDKEGGYSLRAVLLHEVGHLLGMAHSEVEESRMAPTVSHYDEPGENGLYRDDVNGASVLYSGAELIPEPPETVQCSVVPVGLSTSGRGWSLFLVLIALLVMRRKSNAV